MNRQDDEEGTPWPPSNYSPADAAADQAIYEEMKRSVSLRSLLSISPIALVLALRAPNLALALETGVVCGIGNMLLTMWGNERLVNRGNVRVFVLSSFLRLGLFGIIPVVLAIRGPWYAMGVYFAGFFTPLALYAVQVRRRARTG